MGQEGPRRGRPHRGYGKMEKTDIEGGGAFALFGETRSRRARVEGTLRRLLRCIASREFTRTSPATWYTATPPAEAAIRHLSAAGSFAGTTSFIALGSPMGPAGTAFAAGAGSGAGLAGAALGDAGWGAGGAA